MASDAAQPLDPCPRCGFGHAAAYDCGTGRREGARPDLPPELPAGQALRLRRCEPCGGRLLLDPDDTDWELYHLACLACSRSAGAVRLSSEQIAALRRRGRL